MIITRTPMRISIGGGGTDLPSYYRQFGGFVISAAINKYVYITINRTFFDGFFLKYSDVEHAKTYDPRGRVSAPPAASWSAWYTRCMPTSASRSPPRRWPARRSTSR